MTRSDRDSLFANLALVLVLYLGLWHDITALTYLGIGVIWSMLVAYASAYLSSSRKPKQRPRPRALYYAVDLLVIAILIWDEWYVSTGVYLSSMILLEKIYARTPSTDEVEKAMTAMYEIEMQIASPEFMQAWSAAGRHLDKQVQGGIKFWLRAEIRPPFLEHLSFRLGNQLFFIRIEDVDGRIEIPSSIDGLVAIADGCHGHACLMPMKKRLTGEWEPDKPGWGLIDAMTGVTIDPITLVSDERIEMTDWELHDLAVQVVRDELEQCGLKIMTWTGNPGVNPSICFIGESKGPEWVVVRAARYPLAAAECPSNWRDIAQGVSRFSDIGHFASVAFVSTEQGYGPLSGPVVPLWRGYGVHFSYSGITTKSVE